MNNPQLQALATVAFTASELATIVDAVNTLTALLTKIQTAAPNVWAEVTGDYTAAIDQWNAAVRGAHANVSAADAAAVASAPGVTADTPTEVGHAETAGPTVASELGVLANGPVLNIKPVSSDSVQNLEFAVKPILSVSSSTGADAMGVGSHVQAATIKN